MKKNRQLHIAVIDDNEDILSMLQVMLQHKGYKVTTNTSPDNIELFIKETSPDIILMDMLLSGADGREICRHIKANASFAHIPVIMLSAHPQAQVDCLAAGANYFIGKPFEMSEFFKTVGDSALTISDYEG